MLAWLGTAAGSAWLTIGVAGFLLCALWETLTPDRAMERGAAKRWVNNLILYAAGVALGAAIVPQWISLEPRLAFKAIQNAGGDVAVLVAGILGSICWFMPCTEPSIACFSCGASMQCIIPILPSMPAPRCGTTRWSSSRWG